MISKTMSQRVLSASTSTVLGRGIHTHPDVAAAIFNEPSSPSMMTSRIPGPRAMEYLKGLNQMQDTRAAMLVQDIPASLGNYAVDIDGNTLLDLFAQ